MKAVHARRMKRLIDFLEALPRRKFDFGEWTDGWDAKNGCGTTACAMGWAGTIPLFQRLGIRQKMVRSFDSDANKAYFDSVLDCFDPGTGHDESPLYAAARVFEIEFEEARYLFNPNRVHEDLDDSPARRATPKEVARHLRRFLKFKGFAEIAAS